MKPGAFALNPHAASYIPLSRREGYVGESMRSMSPTLVTQNQHHVASLESVSPGIRKLSSPEISLGKKPSEKDGPHSSFAQNPGEMTFKQIRDEDLEMDMDIEYLQITFPGLSHDSIVDVYFANNNDLEETIDMLNQLGIYSVESPENLPDTLDIGDVFESGPLTSKQKNASIEATASALDRHL